MTWRCPLPLQLVPTHESESFRTMPRGATGLPLPGHPGAFAAVRTHHIHEGVDLYCDQGTPVHAVEPGRVVAVLPFTGPKAGLPWWLDTEVVLVEGASGVVAYGEVASCVSVGQDLAAGTALGCVARVLRHDKGRPTSMLHLELHSRGACTCPAWELKGNRPATLQDPTELLLAAKALGADQ